MWEKSPTDFRFYQKPLPGLPHPSSVSVRFKRKRRGGFNGFRITSYNVCYTKLLRLTFRTPSEAIELANNTRYGLAASVWSDNINLALDVASKIKAGSVWVNCTNLFDGAGAYAALRYDGEPVPPVIALDAARNNFV